MEKNMKKNVPITKSIGCIAEIKHNTVSQLEFNKIKRWNSSDTSYQYLCRPLSTIQQCFTEVGGRK